MASLLPSHDGVTILKRALIIGVGLLLVIQVIRPARTNPPTDPAKTLDATLHPPANVSALLERGCSDCHTNNTVWPWYTNVAPLSWWIINHVNEGRRRVSFSDWGNYDADKQARELTAVCTRLERHNMPLLSYLLMHPDARLTDLERKTICDWTHTVPGVGQ